MKKVIMSLLIVVTTIGLLVGCGKTKVEENASETVKEETKTLDIVWFSDGKEGETLRALADQYEEENKGIKIELIQVPYADLQNKIKNMINAGEAPALARLTNIGTFRNQLVDLYEKLGNKEELKANFTNSIKYEFDGKMLAAPMDVTANGLIYNKTAFDKAGVSVPQSPDEVWTWEEWKDAMVKVMKNSDVKYGLVYDKSPQRFTTLIYQAGGSMLNSDLTASAFNSKEVLRAVKFFKELHDEQIIPESVWVGSENPNNLFRTGQVAMHFSGSWMLGNYKDEITDFEWGVTYLPKDAKRSTIPDGKYIGAFQGSGVEKEAAEFIKWLSKPENNAKYCLENNYMSPVIGNENLDYDFGKEYINVFLNEIAATDVTPATEWGYQKFTSKVETDLRDQLVEVLADQLSPEDYVKNMDKIMSSALEELK